MKRARHALLAVLFFSTVNACAFRSSQSSEETLTQDVAGLPPHSTPGQTTLPVAQLPDVPAGARRVELSAGSYLPVNYSKQGRAFVPVEGIVSEQGFARIQANSALLKLSAIEKQQKLDGILRKVVARVAERVEVRNVYFASEVGYFSAWVPVDEYSALRGVSGLDTDVVIAPRAQSAERPHRDSTMKTTSTAVGSFAADASGIERMGVSEFVRMVQSEVGEAPTGERVRVGVTDTGVTYAHPAFKSSKTNRTRISYMKDFTNEGAGYVSARAALLVKREAEGVMLEAKKRGAVPVLIDAQILMPDSVSGANVAMDEQGRPVLPFKSITNERFVLPETLLLQLEAPDSPVRLGVLSEASFAADGESVDVNGNGKNDDEFYFFVVMKHEGKEEVYIDFSGTKDFTRVKAMGDFNRTRETTPVFSERIGVAITSVPLGTASDAQSSEKTTRIALVGFDPGNHGSHVAGIIGAQRFLSNDAPSTQARGVAPEVDLMVGRVCANNSGCQATRAIIDMARQGAQVINMSLGGLSPMNDGYGVQETVINRLTELYNVLFVISAGNSGPGRQTVGSPSTARHALSVAATANRGMIARQYQWQSNADASPTGTDADEDFVMFFSSRGPSAAGGFKPNISAPGTQLSTIQLNAAAGNRAGLDVYWGTSMAAPAAAGAIALLMDAAHRYNLKNPSRAMPTDALTLRRVLLDSARPFQTNSFNPTTGQVSKGVYTWIDQGYGMVSLPRAWELLKKKAGAQLPSGVVLNDGRHSAAPLHAALDYNVRVVRSLGNGLKYDGMQSFDTGALVGTAQSERKFGQGVWLTPQESDALVEVHVSRTLNLKDLGRRDVGELLRQLNTSAESFVLETVYYGGRVEWLKVGVPQSAACMDSSTPARPELTIFGAGAIALPADADARTGLNPSRPSALYLCLLKNVMSELPPGDHGALIRAYKVVNGTRDVTASFEIPVYMTVPHHSASLQAQFSLSKQVGSFMVDRHYVQVPKGVSVLRVSLDVPKLDSASSRRLCSGVSLMVLAGGNTKTPADLASQGSVAQNCSNLGSPISNRLSVGFSEMNPLPGVWDLHVFGRYQFPTSSYALKIDYAAFADVPALELKADTVASGTFAVQLKESTFDAAPDAGKSQFNLKSLVARMQHEIAKSQGVRVVPAATGALARRYPADVGAVTVTTTSSMAGLDIDMVVDECEDEHLQICKVVGSSGSATADERVVFKPNSEKFYAVRIDPYEVPADVAGFVAVETLEMRESESGALSIESNPSTPGRFNVLYSFDVAQSQLLKHPLHVSGPYRIAGSVKLASSAGVGLIHVPVGVERP